MPAADGPTCSLGVVPGRGGSLECGHLGITFLAVLNSGGGGVGWSAWLEGGLLADVPGSFRDGRHRGCGGYGSCSMKVKGSWSCESISSPAEVLLYQPRGYHAECMLVVAVLRRR
jgi:hypothetical protein